MKISLAIAVALMRLASASQCYYPDGTAPTDYTYRACTSGGVSSCCIPGEGDQCLSNGLCFWPAGNYAFRGACTDQTWNSGNCTSFCKSSNIGGWEQLESCGGTKYCCISDGVDCCNHASYIFDIGVPSVINDFSAGTTVTPTAVANLLITASSTASTTGAASGSSQSSASANSSNTSETNNGIGTGALVGIAGGIITFAVLVAAAVIAYYCIKRRKANKQPSQNLIDMNGPNVSVGVIRPGTGYSGYQREKYPGTPQTPEWDSAPAYQRDFYASNQDLLPKGLNGVTLIELQSSPAHPVDNNGHQRHELA
ncbi:hypothetical protein BT63DRAFT_479255 [Microthyrium microscopicum]|uniref:Mid2 domain-containing protein n=1 Tax=Microthyrium microscopicum TaxID=703497 RepID=A0A6A6UCN8_9PEZI|nr:hypothetical protein BT63DRAFT_479255 [Microthyrium microscopicum]